MMLIDRVGRKTLLLVGCIGMTITLSGIAAIFIFGHWRSALIFLLAAYIASFAISSGAVIWVYMSEIFPNAVRVKGQALGSTTLWVMNGIISQVFPWMAAKSSSLTFVIFASLMALQFVVIFSFYPETKGLSLEELEAKLR
jgi:MFS family permease